MHYIEHVILFLTRGNQSVPNRYTRVGIKKDSFRYHITPPWLQLLVHIGIDRGIPPLYTAYLPPERVWI